MSNDVEVNKEEIELPLNEISTNMVNTKQNKTVLSDKNK